MKKLLFSLFAFTTSLTTYCQDSLYYSVQWKPYHAYQKAGVKQEGIFFYRYINDV